MKVDLQYATSLAQVIAFRRESITDLYEFVVCVRACVCVSVCRDHTHDPDHFPPKPHYKTFAKLPLLALLQTPLQCSRQGLLAF